jgi:hypothetical protein
MAEYTLEGIEAVLRALQAFDMRHAHDVAAQFQEGHAQGDGHLTQASEGFYGALDGLQDDRAEAAHDYGLDQLHDRLDALLHEQQQEQQQERGHDQGMDV